MGYNSGLKGLNPISKYKMRNLLALKATAE
jgi:hypothetical protein